MQTFFYATQNTPKKTYTNTSEQYFNLYPNDQANADFAERSKACRANLDTSFLKVFSTFLCSSIMETLKILKACFKYVNLEDIFFGKIVKPFDIQLVKQIMFLKIEM